MIEYFKGLIDSCNDVVVLQEKVYIDICRNYSNWYHVPAQLRDYYSKKQDELVKKWMLKYYGSDPFIRDLYGV